MMELPSSSCYFHCLLSLQLQNGGIQQLIFQSYVPTSIQVFLKTKCSMSLQRLASADDLDLQVLPYFSGGMSMIADLKQELKSYNWLFKNFSGCRESCNSATVSVHWLWAYSFALTMHHIF